MQEDLEASRDGRPTVRDAIAACDQPTVAIQLAFDEAAADRNAVIRAGWLLAGLIAPRSTIFDLLNPMPKPLDVVERWAGKGRDRATRVMRDTKAFGIAIALVTAITLIAKAVALEAWIRKSDLNKVLLTAVAGVAIYLVAWLIKKWLNLEVERRANELDEQQPNLERDRQGPTSIAPQHEPVAIRARRGSRSQALACRPPRSGKSTLIPERFAPR